MMDANEYTPASLPSEDKEAQIFWRMRWRIGRTQLRQILSTSRLRTGLVLSLSLLFWTGLFALFYAGFDFIVTHVGPPGADYHAKTVQFVFHLFFASLNVMLVFSAGIIIYGNLFHAPETRYLLTLPIRAERIVLHKFQEAVLFSSWGFFLLASPMMVAYGWVVGAPWYYYALILPLIIAFVYIPCSIGAICCLFIVHKLPQLRRVIVGTAAISMIVFAVNSIWRTVSNNQARLFGKEWFDETLRRFGFTQEEWLPSSWLANGLLEAARQTPVATIDASHFDLPVLQSCMYLALLISNALMFHLFTVEAGKRWLRSGFSCLDCRHVKVRKARVSWLDRAANWILGPFPQPVRLLLVKDWRLLRRDPVQWSQFLIFFGLLGLYFLNVDRFNNPTSDISYITWLNMVSFLNLAVVGLILSTFTTRFIYPMLSLEGHRFWILGLLPIRRETIVWSKFVFAALGSWIPCSILILLSDLMLQVPMLVVLVHQLTTVLLCVGLAAIAVGLGATMPNFREPSPSKIAAGFGGTLNLVLSALYIIGIVVLTALPCHFYLIADRSSLRDSILNPNYLRLWLIAGTGLAILVCAVATIVPLSRGLRAFRKLEFL
jgi:ABC-2 type transport system permease protein